MLVSLNQNHREVGRTLAEGNGAKHFDVQKT